MSSRERWPRVAVPHWGGTNVQAYCDRLGKAGLAAVEICSPEEIGEIETCAGLLLPGGADIDPALYDAAPDPRTQTPVRARDNFELDLLRESLTAGIPVLAICRGHQLLNVALGGRLCQHIENGRHEAKPIENKMVSQAHSVVIEPSTLLAAVFEPGPLLVNSRHHQAVTPASLASSLKPSALSDDGLVEGFESASGHWLVGVQWHPEREEPQITGFAEASRLLFEAFARAVRSA